MKEPIEPSKEDCCNSGCNPCIFDVYEKQLLFFKEYQKKGGNDQKVHENGISQLKYTIFTVADNILISEAHQLLLFQPKCNSGKIFWKPGDHFLIKYTSGSNSCSRAYTPLKAKVKCDSEFSVIVKRYNQGVVSRYLCDLKPGHETLWRGPYGAYDILLNKFNRIIMVAQGTGIAPFFSIIENILSNEDDITRLILYYCCHSKESILLREELYSWKRYWNFTYSVYLSDVNENDDYKYGEPIIKHKLDMDALFLMKPFTSRDQFLICGSTQFMSYYKNCLEKEVQNIVLF